MKQKNDPIEAVRTQLNKIPEKDQNGNYTRFGVQLFIWVLGRLAETSSNMKTRNAGLILSRGAENSFADYMGQKVAETITKLFRDNNNYYV